MTEIYGVGFNEPAYAGDRVLASGEGGEQSLGIHYNKGSDLLDYLADPAVFQFEDGFVRRLTAPGLGIEIDEEKVREAAARGHAWHCPVWRNVDGSVTEW